MFLGTPSLWPSQRHSSQFLPNDWNAINNKWMSQPDGEIWRWTRANLSAAPTSQPHVGAEWPTTHWRAEIPLFKKHPRSHPWGHPLPNGSG